MINENTVFVLGAGASYPYGLLLGSELRGEICGAATGNPAHVLISVSEQKLGIHREEVIKFAVAFRNSARLSIDAFLSQRNDLVDIGKYCIAIELCRREDPEKVLQGADDHWCALLWDAITSDGATLGDVQKCPVHFVTFNHDRSLEYFFFEAIKHSFNVSDSVALTTVRSLNINHVYGSLGEFGAETTDSARPYTQDVSSKSLTIAAKALRIIPEARDDDDTFHRARDVISRAKRQCFLGFGFDFLNLQRLKVPAALEAFKHRPQIVASTFKKTAAEIKEYRRRVCGANNSWGTFSTDNTMTLRESGVLLSKL